MPDEEEPPRCHTCRYWDGLSDGSGKDENQYGRCHRLPPVLVLLQVDPRNSDFSNQDHGVWPLTHEIDWCGEWQPE